jgi:lipid II:glycine glycyltransferase (peptidoglycan interpeptide bridge formation enzyme)
VDSEFPVVTWNPVEQHLTQEKWDRLLAGNANTQIFQSFGWGEYKRSAGWRPTRFIAQNNGGEITAIAQTLVRVLPGGLSFVWVPGGPLIGAGQEKVGISELLAGFQAGVRAHVGRSYIRCNFTFPADAAASFDTARVLSKPAVRLGSGYSVLLRISGDDEAWLKSLTAKHRYYVRKACASDLSWRYGNGDAELAALAKLAVQMLKDKHIQAPVYSLSDLQRLRELLGDGCRVLIGNAEGESVTACMVLRFGSHAFFATAATIGRGRELSAAYALVAQLRRRLMSDQVKVLDFGGIDPKASSAQGVNHFKLGFGGTVVEYLGEWEWAANPIHRWLGNLAVAVRRRGL